MFLKLVWINKNSQVFKLGKNLHAEENGMIDYSSIKYFFFETGRWQYNATSFDRNEILVIYLLSSECDSWLAEDV